MLVELLLCRNTLGSSTLELQPLQSKKDISISGTVRDILFHTSEVLQEGVCNPWMLHKPKMVCFGILY
jgi:hypothetical protein